MPKDKQPLNDETKQPDRNSSSDDKPSLRPGEYEIGEPGTKRIQDIDEEDQQKWGTARFSNRMVLELKETETGEVFRFNYETITHIYIGREDAVSGAAPDINLTPYGALDKGVSRRHASILQRDGALNIIDEGSPNGTYLNGQKLVAHQPRILRDGDDIRLGHIVLRVSFHKMDGSSDASGRFMGLTI